MEQKYNALAHHFMFISAAGKKWVVYIRNGLTFFFRGRDTSIGDRRTDDTYEVEAKLEACWDSSIEGFGVSDL